MNTEGSTNNSEGTEFWRIVSSPHFVQSEPELREYDRQRLSAEYRSFFGEILQRSEAVGEGFSFAMLKHEGSIIIGYKVPKSFGLSGLVQSNRFLQLRQDPSALLDLSAWSRLLVKSRLSRRVTKQPRYVLGGHIGDMSRTNKGESVVSSLKREELRLLEFDEDVTNIFRSQEVVGLPTVSTFVDPIGQSRWVSILRHLTLSDLPSGFQIVIRPYAPSTTAISYSQKCLLLYLNTYRTLSDGGHEANDLAVHRAIFGQQDLFSVHAQVAVHSLQAFFQDTNSEVLQQVQDRLPLSVDSLSEDTAAIVRELPTTFGKIEALSLCVPPFSFVDALPGLLNEIPKPFIVPEVRGVVGERVVSLGYANSCVEVELPERELARHVLICGSSGSGKSYAGQAILLGLDPEVPFLIIEPAKTSTSYKNFLMSAKEKRGRDTRIIELGTERGCSFNPFLVPVGSTVFAHSAILARAMSMLTPSTPAAYELWLGMVRATYKKMWEDPVAPGETIPPYREALYGKGPVGSVPVYAERYRSVWKRKFPTLHDVRENGSSWIDKLSLDPRTKFAVEARDYIMRWWSSVETVHPLFWNTLSDTGSDYWAETLFANDTLLTLGMVTDRQESASLVALILFLLSEYRIGESRREAVRQETPKPLKHVTIVEEAHRVMPSKSRGYGSESSPSPQEEAGMMMSQMLAELREYGEGFIMAEQSPSKLLSDSMINTGTKIIKRTIYGPDIASLGEAVGLSVRERSYLSKLDQREAVVLTPSASQALFVKTER